MINNYILVFESLNTREFVISLFIERGTFKQIVLERACQGIMAFEATMGHIYMYGLKWLIQQINSILYVDIAIIDIFEFYSLFVNNKSLLIISK